MKKIISAALALITLIGTLTFTVPKAGAANVSFDEIVNAAVGIIMPNEGSYKSVAADDNGALSVGCIQWHAGRALNLLRSIVNANKNNALSILGSALYNEILNTSTVWTSRVLTANEATLISRLLDTAEGHAEQDKLLKNDISAYINHGISLGITSPSTLVYFADIENQCGGGGSKRIADAALALAGSYSAITVELLHKAALADAAAGKAIFIPRRDATYTYCVKLGWNSADIRPFESWCATANLNIRSGAGTDYSSVSMLYSGRSTVITEKCIADGSLWGKNSVGWLCLEYCSYESGNLPTPIYFCTGEASDTISVNGVNAFRNLDMVIIYDGSYSSSNTATNIYGAEAIVNSDGMVVSDPVIGQGSSQIPAGGFVISAHSDDIYKRGVELCSKVKAGDYVLFNRHTMTVEVFKDRASYIAASEKVPRDTIHADGVNSPRYDSNLIVYDYSYQYSTTKTNSYGAEVMVGSDGRVAFNTVVCVGNMQIPWNGFVLSGNDGTYASRGTEIINKVKVNDYIYFSSGNMTADIFNDNNSYMLAHKSVTPGSAYNALPTLNVPGKTFDGWYDASGELVTSQTIMSSHGIVRLYPRWVSDAPVTFDLNGGAFDGVITKAIDGVNSYRFANNIILYNGNYSSSTTGTNKYGTEILVDASGKVLNNPVTGQCDSTIPTGGFVLSGHDNGLYWLQANISVGNYVTFDSRTNTITVYRDAGVINAIFGDRTANAPIGALPSASRSGCYQLDWCDESGNVVNENTIVPTGGIKLYARWMQHANTTETVVVSPTCTTTGQSTVYCNLCGAKVSENIIPVTDHKWTETNTVLATCASGGYTEYVCEYDMSHTRREDIPATGEHTPGDAVTVREATCAENGLKTVSCTVCETLLSEEIIPATGHKWVEKEDVPPTSDSSGYVLYVCEHDGEHIMKCSVDEDDVSFGDVNGDGDVDADDAIYLLYSLSDFENYPVNLKLHRYGDFNGDGVMDSDDAIYLLYYTLLPDLYPLNN